MDAITITLPTSDWQAIVAAMRQGQEDLEVDDEYYNPAELAEILVEWDRITEQISAIVDLAEADLDAAA